MNYLSREQFNHEDSLTYPDRLWVVMYNDDQNWSNPITDKHEAEQEYWRAKDSGENVEIGYTYEGRFTSRWSDNINEFNSVRL